MERTLVLVKPDGVQRGLIGEVISRLERRGLRLVAAKFMNVSRQLAELIMQFTRASRFMMA